MQGRSFAAVLDDALTRDAAGPRAAMRAPWRRWPEPQSASPFLSVPPLTTARARWVTVEGPARHRPAHRLTGMQRCAFERLRVLGADLPDGFTLAELQREYRRLARRFHPDLHGHCSPLERDQRARNFAEAAADYACLREVVERRH